MTGISTLSTSSLWLIAILGLRHGLDPDHVAVIDNLTFQAAEERPVLAPWTGTLFALGHSLSVAAIAVGVAGIAARFQWPQWLSVLTDWAVIGLLMLIGVLNLRALRRSSTYTPVGWRQRFLPEALRSSTHPLAILAIGIIFGLVFDTATQAAAWGVAAGSTQGIKGAIFVASAFAAGMIMTDTVDSQIVARLLRGGKDHSRIQYYRRAVGWLIVTLSFGMAAYALLAMFVSAAELPTPVFTALGCVMAVAVALLLLRARQRVSAVSGTSHGILNKRLDKNSG